MPRRAKTSEISPASANDKKLAALAPLDSSQKVEPIRRGRRLFKKGEIHNPNGPPPGKRLLTRVREILQERSLSKNGRYNTRFDDAAEAFVRSMEGGSYVHLKEYIEREEGKIPQKLVGVDENEVKIYIGMPTDGDEAP